MQVNQESHLRGAVVLLSGGIDSFACAHFLRRNNFIPSAIFVDYGQVAGKQELAASARISARLGIKRTIVRLRARPSEQFNAGEIPGRNLALLSIAALFAHGAGVVALGIHSGTRYFDCSRSFADQADRLIAECTDGTMALFAPFLHWRKEDIIAYARSEGLDLSLTYSCEVGTMPPCGACSSCRDREALSC
jgi:7-cyano-7-deazaguanine synthase